MHILETVPFTLNNFEGPMDYLVHLVLRGEIDIYDVPLCLLTEQFVDRHSNDGCPLEVGAEFVGIAATLMLLKSKRLLPKDNTAPVEEEPLESDPRFEIIHQLVEYCRFKKAAQLLAQKEKQQSEFHYRQLGMSPVPRPTGLDSISLEDLSSLFKGVLSRAAASTGKVYEERYRVADAIRSLRKRLETQSSLYFYDVFQMSMCREELITSFLAVLELMKTGTLQVINRDGSPMIISASHNG